MPRNYEGDFKERSKYDKNGRGTKNILNDKSYYGLSDTPAPEPFSPNVPIELKKGTLIIEDPARGTTVRVTAGGARSHEKSTPEWDERDPYSEDEAKGKKKINDWLDDAQTVPDDSQDYQQPLMPSNRSRTFQQEDYRYQERIIPPNRSRTFQEEEKWSGGEKQQTRGRAYKSTETRRDSMPSGGYEQQEIAKIHPDDIEARAYNNYQRKIKDWYATHITYPGCLVIAEWEALTPGGRQEYREKAKAQIQAEIAQSSARTKKSYPKNSDIPRFGPQQEKITINESRAIPIRPALKASRRPSDSYDKQRPIDSSRQNRAQEKTDPRRETKEFSSNEIEARAKQIYNDGLDKYINSNWEAYDRQRKNGILPATWSERSKETQDTYRSTAYAELLAERERNTFTRKEVPSERNRPTARDTYQINEDRARPPVTKRDYATQPKRSSSKFRKEW